MEVRAGTTNRERYIIVDMMKADLYFDYCTISLRLESSSRRYREIQGDRG